MKVVRVLLADPMPPEELRPLRRRPFRLLSRHPRIPLSRQIAGCEAVIVRSSTRITAGLVGAAKNLRLIGRAGVGVDNIDVAAATRAGIAVLNVPEAATVSVAEHTLGLILALLRKIPAADGSVRAGRWERSAFTGEELLGKTVGVVGLGRIGREVVRRLASFGCRILAYDPFLPREWLEGLGVQAVRFREILRESDLLTLHVPLTPKTRGWIGRQELRRMKRGAVLINTSRGGIVDEKPLAEALREGRLAGAAVDVFEREPPVGSPLLSAPNCVLAPHLGAATRQARQRVGADLTASVADFFLRGILRNAVNAPDLDPAQLAEYRPYLDLARRLGRLGRCLVTRPRRMRITCAGSLSRYRTEPLTRRALEGLLGADWVNGRVLARRMGLKVEEKTTEEAGGYVGRLELEIQGGDNRCSLAGTWIPGEGPLIVSLNGLSIDLVPQGRMILVDNQDRPGRIGAVGEILGRAGVNIADMRVGRRRRGGQAVMAFTVDSPVGPKVLAALRAVPGIRRVRVAEL